MRSAGPARTAPATAARRPATAAAQPAVQTTSGRANSICQEEMVMSTGPPPLIQAPFDDQKHRGQRGRHNPQRRPRLRQHQGRRIAANVAGHAEIDHRIRTAGRDNAPRPRSSTAVACRASPMPGQSTAETPLARPYYSSPNCRRSPPRGLADARSRSPAARHRPRGSVFPSRPADSTNRSCRASGR